MTLSIESIGGILRPTYLGLIATEEDARLILAACLSGELPHAARYPRGNELQNLVRSGHAFVYADPATGTGNWDDGKDWEYLGDEDGFRIECQGSSRDRLYKRSISIIENGVTHHMVSYYRLVDAVESYSEEGGVLKSLTRPSQEIKNVAHRLISKDSVNPQASCGL